MTDFYDLFKPLAFLLPAETVHDTTAKILHSFPGLANHWNIDLCNNRYHLQDKNISWPFPVGIAAGLDKNIQMTKFLFRLGFGNVEVGTITLKGQQGNPRPRIQRWPHEEALTNSMGFPNLGSEILYKRIQQLKLNPENCLGINIGKNKDTKAHAAANEYAQLAKIFSEYAHYITVNISSPNTPGLRDLAAIESLSPILKATKNASKCPIYVKISPDMNREDVISIVQLCIELDIEGIVATNTTKQHQHGKGGLSGAPLKSLSLQIRKWIFEALKETDKLSIIAAGGITNYSDLVEHWKLGGKFVQIYTAFIYRGPKILENFKNGIDNDLRKFNLDNLDELVRHYQNN